MNPIASSPIGTSGGLSSLARQSLQQRSLMSGEEANPLQQELQSVLSQALSSPANPGQTGDTYAELAKKFSETKGGDQETSEFQEAFRDFVGQTFFGQMLASLRSTQSEPAYFHGGQAEKIFQGQLDQQLAETLSDQSAPKLADPMYHLYQLRQRR